MFSSFKYQAKQKQHLQNTVQRKLVLGIAATCRRMLLQWATYLQRRTEGLSGKTKRFCLALFCLLAGGYSLYHAMDSFGSQKSNPLSIINIRVPAHVANTTADSIQHPMVATETYQSVQRFRIYIDSLGQSIPGKKTKDSILLSRPGLLDSSLIIEHLFRSQPSKK
jgi:cation transport ATPase